MKLISIVLLAWLSVAPSYAQQGNVPANCETASLDGGCQLFGVSIIQLLANPDEYDGKSVRLVGYIHFEFEGAGIYFHKEDLDQGIYRNGFWVSLAPGFSSDQCQDSYVLIEGVFDAKSTGHMGLWSGTVRSVERCIKWPPQ